MEKLRLSAVNCRYPAFNRRGGIHIQALLVPKAKLSLASPLPLRPRSNSRSCQIFLGSMAREARHPRWEPVSSGTQGEVSSLELSVTQVGNMGSGCFSSLWWPQWLVPTMYPPWRMTGRSGFRLMQWGVASSRPTQEFSLQSSSCLCLAPEQGAWEGLGTVWILPPACLGCGTP